MVVAEPFRGISDQFCEFGTCDEHHDLQICYVCGKKFCPTHTNDHHCAGSWVSSRIKLYNNIDDLLDPDIPQIKPVESKEFCQYIPCSNSTYLKECPECHKKFCLTHMPTHKCIEKEETNHHDQFLDLPEPDPHPVIKKKGFLENLFG